MTAKISLLIVGGIQRGGTTLLRNVLMSHPYISFYPFEAKTLPKYELTVKAHIWDILRANLKSVIWRRDHHRYLFCSQYIKSIVKCSGFKGFITLDKVHHAMIESLSQSSDIYVGDKHPDYIVSYPQFIHRPNTKCFFIYRHPYDVVASTLKRVNGDWRGRAWAVKYDSVEKISHYWVSRMQMIVDIQKLDSNALILRYEHFVTETSQVVIQIADHLDTDVELFDVMLPHEKSIGKYKSMLSEDAIGIINEIAGEMMRKFNYL